MSTAAWKIDKETAEIIWPVRSDESSLDLDRAWPSNWALHSANQYEWCHIFDGGIECVHCGIGHILDQDNEYDRRKVTWEWKGETHEGLEFCTYEFTERMYCDCGRTLGGWMEECHICENICDNYDGLRGDEEKRHLIGYLHKGMILDFDDVPSSDIADQLKPICDKCLDENYDVDWTSYATVPYLGDNQASTITKKGK